MKKRDFNILKETISPQNVQVMSELITIQEIKFLIGYIGAPILATTKPSNLLKGKSTFAKILQRETILLSLTLT